ncbi:MAG: hypothetical protein JKY89_12230, partial [Immundisolibacteraceae bacterium]|nr:hypothetical protein [Immundisolibacteraceae bacterium]
MNFFTGSNQKYKNHNKLKNKLIYSNSYNKVVDAFYLFKERMNNMSILPNNFIKGELKKIDDNQGSEFKNEMDFFLENIILEDKKQNEIKKDKKRLEDLLQLQNSPEVIENSKTLEKQLQKSLNYRLKERDKINNSNLIKQQKILTEQKINLIKNWFDKISESIFNKDVHARNFTAFYASEYEKYVKFYNDESIFGIIKRLYIPLEMFGFIIFTAIYFFFRDIKMKLVKQKT